MNKNVWFKKKELFYFPLSWQGYFIFFFALMFLVNTFIAIDRNSHSVSDTLYGIFPFWVPTFLIIDWIASKKSK